MDGDGAEMIEMMAGQPPQSILATIYNGSTACVGCGTLMTPVSKMYSGNRCSGCSSKKAARSLKNRMA